MAPLEECSVLRNDFKYSWNKSDRSLWQILHKNFNFHTQIYKNMIQSATETF
jgi:hypothetical protein